MAVNLLYNLGNSDIYINEKPISKETNFLELTKTIWEHLDLFKPVIKGNFKLNQKDVLSLSYNGYAIKSVNFPIFSEFFFAIKNNYKITPERLFLFTTKQANPHQKDTYYVAEIIKYILQKSFFSKNVEGVIVEVIEENPSDYEKMDRYFADIVAKYENILKNASLNFFQIATGTPAMSFSLALNLSLFSNVKYLYVVNTEDKDKVREVKYFKILNFKKYLEMIKNLLDVYEYEGARRIFEESPIRRIRVVKDLLDIVIARRELRFEGGLNKARDLIEEKPDIFIPVSEYFSEIMDSKKDLVVWAAFEEMEIYIDRKEYHIALASYFNVMENLVSYLISQLGKDPESLRKDNGDYYNHYERIDWIKKNVKDKPPKKPFSVLFDKEFEKIDQKIREKRNKGPLAHGFSGIEESDKEEIMKLHKKLKDVLVELSIPKLKGINFYKYMNGVIYDYLEKGLSNL